MKNGRNQTDVLSIERTLGLKSERGVSRQGNKDSPPIEAILKGIKTIMVAYVNQDLTIIRDSDELKADATTLFNKYGPQIWPAPNEPRPHWIEEPSDTRYEGKYTQARHYTIPEDYEYLKERFIQLVIEKSCNYHENQLQKHRRHTAKALQSQLNPDNECDDSRGEEGDHDGSDSPGQPASKMDEFQSQFAAYTQPVPDEDFKPHGLPLNGGAHAQSRSARKRPRNNNSAEENVTPKRARSESVTGSSQGESLVVKLQIGEQAVGRLADTGKVQSAYSFQPINGKPTRESIEPPRAHGFNPVNAAPPPIAPPASAPPSSAPSISAPPIDPPSGSKQPPTASSPQPSSAPNSSRMLPSALVPPHQRPPPTLTGFPGTNESASDSPRMDQRRDDTQAQSDPRNYESPYGQHHPGFQGQKPEQFRPGFQPVNALPPSTRPPVMPLPPQPHAPPTHTMQNNPFRTFPPGPPAGPVVVPPPPTFNAPHPPGQPPSSFNPVRGSHVPLPEPVLSALGLQGPRPQSRSKHIPRRPSSSSHRRPSGAPSLPPMELPAERKEHIPHPHATPDPMDQDQVYFEEVLGELALCPVIYKLKEELGPKMPRHRLEKLKKLLVDFPDARIELEALERRARMPTEQYESERLPPPPGWVQNPGGGWVPGSHAQQPPQNMYPHPHGFGRDAALTPRPTPGPPGGQQRVEPPSTPHVKEEHHETPLGRSLENIDIEINWNRNLDYSDHVEMQEFDTVQKLFDIVEEARPDELIMGGDVIKEIRIKSKTELQGPGGQVLPRIVHDETRGRAGVKQLIRRLRSQPADMEIELVFEVMWKPAEVAKPA